MRDRRPPHIAEWLLSRFGITQRNEALIGDLAEEFQNGRSATWYWKQTAVAILRNGRLVPGFGIASFAGWALQLIPALLVSTYEFPASRVVAGVCGVCLACLQMRARRLLVGSEFRWRDLRGFLRDPNGPFNWRGVPLWALIACDEFADYLVTCLLLYAAIGRFRLTAFVFCEILWLIAHVFVEPAVIRLRSNRNPRR